MSQPLGVFVDEISKWAEACRDAEPDDDWAGRGFTRRTPESAL